MHRPDHAHRPTLQKGPGSMAEVRGYDFLDPSRTMRAHFRVDRIKVSQSPGKGDGDHRVRRSAGVLSAWPTGREEIWTVSAAIIKKRLWARIGKERKYGESCQRQTAASSRRRGGWDHAARGWRRVNGSWRWCTNVLIGELLAQPHKVREAPQHDGLSWAVVRPRRLGADAVRRVPVMD